MTLIKPPCCNGTIQDRQPIKHLLEASTTISTADIQKKAYDIDWSDTTHYWMGDRHGDEKVFIFENAVKYARTLGYMPSTDEEGRLNSPWIVKGYNQETSALDKSKFRCMLIAEDTANLSYASKEHIIDNFNKYEQNWETFKHTLMDSMEQTVNNCLIDDSSRKLSQEDILAYIESHATDFVNSLFIHDPYHVTDPWNDAVLCMEDWDLYIKET